MEPNTLSCPACGKALKVGTALPPGKKVKCPKCETVFAVGGSGDKAAARPKSSPRLPEGRRPRPDDEDDEERGRPRRREEETGVRKTRRPAPVAEEDDDTGADDEEDYRPRKGARKPGHRAKGLMIGLAIGGGAGVLAIVFAVLAFVWPGFLKSPASTGGTAVAYQAPANVPQPGGGVLPAPGGAPAAGGMPGNPPAVAAGPGGAGNAGAVAGGNPPAVGANPAPGAAGPLAAVPAGTVLTYRLRPGENYVYAVNVVADRDDETETIQGHLELAVKSADGNVIRITPSASLPKQVKNKRPTFGPPRMPSLPAMGPPSFGANELRIDTHGKVLGPSHNANLPYLLGDATEWAVEPLSPRGEQRWDRSTDITISEIKRLIPFARLGPRSETSSAARESVTYEVTGIADGVVRIKKKYELKTTEGGAQGQPRIRLDMQGDLSFDPAAGVVKSCDYQGALTVTEPNSSARVPLTISYRLMDAAELAAFRKDQEERRAKAAEMARQAALGRPITDAEITQALADLKSDKPFTVRAAAAKLAGAMPVEARKEEVAAALEALAQDKDGATRAEAAKGLKAWGSAKNVPALVKLVSDDNIFARHQAIEALGKLKDPRGADAVAAVVPDFRVRFQAVNALKAMGPVAEKAVLPLLKHQDWVVRSEACKVLGEVGGKDSVPALKDLLSDSNQLVAAEAGRALKAVDARKGRGG